MADLFWKHHREKTVKSNVCQQFILIQNNENQITEPKTKKNVEICLIWDAHDSESMNHSDDTSTDIRDIYFSIHKYFIHWVLQMCRAILK